MAAVIRSYDDIARNGNPYCPECGVEMDLLPDRRLKDLVGAMNEPIRLM